MARLPAGTQVTRWANQALRDDYLAGVARLACLLATGAAGRSDALNGSGVRRLQHLVREAQVSPHTEVAGTTLAVRQLRELADRIEHTASA